MSTSDSFNPRRDSLGRKAVRLLQAGGGLTGFEIFIAFVTAILLACATNAIYELIIALLSWIAGMAAASNEATARLISVFSIASLSTAGFVALVFYLRQRVKAMVDEVAPQTTVTASPKARVLVLFLSSPQPDKLPDLSEDELKDLTSDNNIRGLALDAKKNAAKVKKFLKNIIKEREDESGNPIRVEGNFLDEGWLKMHMPGLNWRMPLEAIRYQLNKNDPTLERVIVIGSADSGTKSGTHHLDDIFRDFVEKEIGGAFPNVKVWRIADVMQPRVTLVRGETEATIDLARGVEFHDFEALIAVLFRLSRTLRADNIRDHDILIDATGGQVPTSIAAAVFSLLVKNRQFQYVDTNSYSVRAFDINHEFADLTDQA